MYCATHNLAFFLFAILLVTKALLDPRTLRRVFRLSPAAVLLTTYLMSSKDREQDSQGAVLM